MTCNITVVIDWGGALLMLFKPLTKCPGCFSYILIFTFHHVTLKHINDATLLSNVISIFGCHQEVFYGLAPSKVDLYAILLASVFKTFTQAFAVRNSYVGSSGVRLLVFVFQSHVFVSGLCLNPGLLFNSVQGPTWILA